MTTEYTLCVDPSNRTGLNHKGEMVVKVHPVNNNRGIIEMTESQLQKSEDHFRSTNTEVGMKNAELFKKLREETLPNAQAKMLMQVPHKNPRLTTRF